MKNTTLSNTAATPQEGMTCYIAFLRAINVGGHTVKMDVLRWLFESFGFSSVETFIASGNIIFNTTSPSPEVLEKEIEAGLREALGYDVATFIRSDAELAAMAQYQPFPPAELETATALNVAFLADKLEEPAIQKLFTLKSEIDHFHVHEREIYWLCLKKQSESNFSNGVLERTLGLKATLRGINTVQKIVAKYGFI